MSSAATAAAGTLVLVSLLTAVQAAEEPVADALPEPLTLEYALSLADEPHPNLELARADVDDSRATLLDARARTGINASIEGRARWIDPSEASSDQSHNDSSVSLFLRKRLYDFGRTDARLNAANADGRGSELRYVDARQQHRIGIMERFFDVLLADLEYARDNEDMAMEYVHLDRARDRNELGQVSDIDLRAREASYQEARTHRYASDARRRVSRALLASAVNRPGRPPSTLVPPDLPGNDRPVPALGAVQAAAAAHNPVLLAAAQAVTAAQERLAAARAGRRPVLHGEVEASSYAREVGSRENLSAGVVLEIPLYSGGAVAADVAHQRAELRRREAELARTRLAVTRAVLETWEEIGTLQAQRDETRALTAYRDLYLDRSRALYELEVNTDLGDAMARFSEARLRAAQAEFGLALAWARLDALTGGNLPAADAGDAP